MSRLRDGARLSVAVPAVSAWSVGEHLEHLLLSDRKVLAWVDGALALPANGPRKNFPREIGVGLLARGSIPRGRGPAPEFARPTETGRTGLLEGFEALRALADGLSPRIREIEASARTLPHHVLGHFTPAEWLRFLHVHHRHHEAIVRDLLAA